MYTMAGPHFPPDLLCLIRMRDLTHGFPVRISRRALKSLLNPYFLSGGGGGGVGGPVMSKSHAISASAPGWKAH